MEKVEVLKCDKDLYVVQANELVRSRQDDLTLMEAKIIRLAVAQVLEKETDFRTFSCDIVDLAEFLGISKQYVYRDIQNIAVSLMKKSIFIRDTARQTSKPNYKIFNWVDVIEYKDGTITFKLSEELKPYLLGLEELFTSYSYEALIGLPTNYSIRLYELLASWANATVRDAVKTNYTDVPLEKNEFIFTIDYLRDFFNCKDKYPNTSDFINRVIDRSVKAVKERTVMHVTYQKIKKRREIKYIIFRLNDWEGAANA